MNILASEMNQLFNLFDRESALLEETVRSCPASSLARLLLLKKFKENGDSKYLESATTIPVYLSNPLWYSFLMSQTNGIEGQEDTGHFAVNFPESKTEEKEAIAEEQPAPVVAAETAFQPEETTTIVDDGNQDFPDNPIVPGENDVINDAENELEDQQEIPDEDTSDGEIETSQNEEAVQNEETQQLSADTIQEVTETPSSHDEKQLNDQETAFEEKSGDGEIKASEIEVPIQNEETLQLAPGTIQHEAEVPSTQDEKQLDDQDKISEEKGSDDEETSNEEIKTSEIEVPVQKEETLQLAPGTIQQEPESPAVQEEKELNEKAEISDNDGPIIFEPLHTVDFFASQGIHLREEDLENDKLGRQLKSFTGWLKSMKRIHPGRLPEQDEVIEKIIQTSAEGSNVEVDVLTEAMAEVLVKQNKKDKAIEMYNKLSLMNPSKSAYFAAKIESLKTY